MSRTVHLFIPCYIDQYYPAVGMATANILRELDCEPVFLPEQTCCGQPAYNSGYWTECNTLAERFLHLFSDAETIVAPSGSCVSQVKKHYHDLPLSAEARALWEAGRSRIFELSQFITDELGVESWKGRFEATATYHDACHGLRELGIHRQPRQLLESIDGLTLREMHRPDTCCGFGGTFAVKFAGISTAMVENKARWIQDSGVEYVVSADSSCLMHIGGYLERQKIRVKPIHLAEVLWQSRLNLKA